MLLVMMMIWKGQIVGNLMMETGTVDKENINRSNREKRRRQQIPLLLENMRKL